MIKNEKLEKNIHRGEHFDISRVQSPLVYNNFIYKGRYNRIPKVGARKQEWISLFWRYSKEIQVIVIIEVNFCTSKKFKHYKSTSKNCSISDEVVNLAFEIQRNASSLIAWTYICLPSIWSSSGSIPFKNSPLNEDVRNALRFERMQKSLYNIEKKNVTSSTAIITTLSNEEYFVTSILIRLIPFIETRSNMLLVFFLFLSKCHFSCHC